MIKKNSWVKLEQNGKVLCEGYIGRKGQKNCDVIFDNGTRVYSNVPYSLVTEIDAPKDEESKMDKYTIKNFKEFQDGNGHCFAKGTLYANGKSIASINYDGMCCEWDVHFTQKTRDEYHDQFGLDLKSWFNQMADEYNKNKADENQYFSILNHWVEFNIGDKKSHIKAKDYFLKSTEEYKALFKD